MKMKSSSAHSLPVRHCGPAVTRQNSRVLPASLEEVLLGDPCRGPLLPAHRSSDLGRVPAVVVPKLLEGRRVNSCAAFLRLRLTQASSLCLKVCFTWGCSGHGGCGHGYRRASTWRRTTRE